MDRVLLNKKNHISSDVLETQFFLFDASKGELNIPNNCQVNVLINSFKKDNNLVINVEKNATAIISLLIKENIDNSNIKINIQEGSQVEFYFADFSYGKERFSFIGNLNEKNSSLRWHLSSLTAKGDNKTFDISVNHNSGSTYARMDNYGVCKDDGKLVFSGISTIFNGSKESKTHQNSRIMVFDKLSDGIAKPILKIDENDVEASHAAVVGKINDDHLFYLTSRGLSESAAKELITFGYLKPIMNGFTEESIKEEISSLIEGRM